jgi:hypothetical protein
MRVAYWISKATNTNSQYVTHIAFPLQLWLQERTSMLHLSFIACLVYFKAQKMSTEVRPIDFINYKNTDWPKNDLF